MAHDGDLKVRSNAVWAISNAFYKATPQQALCMVTMGFFEACKTALEQIKDLKIVFVVLEAITFCLTSGDELQFPCNPFPSQITDSDLKDRLEQIVTDHENT